MDTGLIWVLAALVGALSQTGRNLMQSGLTAALGTLGATQVRFLFGLPFALLFLALMPGLVGEGLPALNARSLTFTAFGALGQIGGTAFMLSIMRRRAFGVATAWIKTEPVMVVLLSAAVLGEALTLPAFLAIGVAVAGVLLVSVKPGTLGGHALDLGPMAAGLGAGLLFGVAAIGFRGGITALEGGFVIRATTVLALALTIQAGVLLIWLLAFDRPALIGSFRVWHSSVLAGFLGAFASLNWFIAFSLATAAHVRTVALIEVILAQLAATFLLHQPIAGRQLLGMAVMLGGIALLLQAG